MINQNTKFGLALTSLLAITSISGCSDETIDFGPNDGGNSNGSLSATVNIDGIESTFSCNSNLTVGLTHNIECSNSPLSKRLMMSVVGTGNVTVRLDDTLDTTAGFAYSCNSDFITGSMGSCANAALDYNPATRVISATNVTVPYSHYGTAHETTTLTPSANERTLSFSIDATDVPSF